MACGHLWFRPCQVREAPVRHLTLLARSDAEALRHVRLLARRPRAEAVSLLRWAAWKRDEDDVHGLPQDLELLQADRREEAAEAVIASLPQALRSLLLGEFATPATSLTAINRREVAKSPSMQTQTRPFRSVAATAHVSVLAQQADHVTAQCVWD